MKRLKTLRVRFALWVAGLLLAVLAAFGAFVYFSLARQLSASIDYSLQLGASQVIATIDIGDNHQIEPLDSTPESHAVADSLRERGLTVRVLDSTGQVIESFGPYRALPTSPESLTAALDQRSTFATVTDPIGHDSIRFYAAPIVDDGQLVGVVQIAQSLDALQETLDRLLTALLVGGLLLVIVAAIGGYFLVARTLAPIDHITRTARRIAGDAEDLSARLNLPVTEDEVGRLATTFDAMLARLEESFKRERQFTADASHELRTPLAAMQAILNVIRERRRTPEDYDQALADLSDEADQLRSLIEGLLRLARGDTPPPAARETIDLSALLNNVADSLRPLADTKGLTLTCAAPDGLTLCGDSDSLIRLFVNLLDNGVKYTERGGLTVTAHSNGNAINVAVSDTGCGIPAEDLPHVFDRFYRVDTSRSSRGAGLGLAIALDIARAHGGTIEVNSDPGAGSIFTVLLPK